MTQSQLGNILGRVQGAGATNIQEIIILPRLSLESEDTSSAKEDKYIK